MEVQAEVYAAAGREFWRDALLAGGFTSMPRWTPDPIAGVAMYDAAIPSELGAASGRLADELNVPLSSVLLAAHAKVLSALSGERRVVTGYLAGIGPEPLPFPLTTEAESWRELVFDAHRREAQLLSYADFPLDELRGELSVTGPALETVFDPTGVAGELGDDAVLRLGIAERNDGLFVRMR